MKLAKITTLDDPYYLQLRWILNGQDPMVVEHTVLQLKKVGRNFREPRPIPYIFIESVIESNIFSEGSFVELFKAGITKLKAALTPGPGGDVETLLTFMAPKGGGITAINNLIKQASSSQGSLLDDTAWWEQMFGAFNVGDQPTKIDVQQRVQQDILSGGVEAEAAAPAAGLDGTREEIKQKIGGLLNHLGKMRGGSTRTESIGETTDIALTLLNEHSVKSNIGPICNMMLQRIGVHHNVKMPIISESGLLQRLKDAIGGIPGKIKGGANTTGVSNNNERAAKLAVQILSDIKRSEFESTLSANGLTPDQIVTTLGQWKDLKPKAEAGDPESVQTYNQASETLKKAFKLFNHGNTKNDFNQIEAPEENVPGEGPDPLAVDQGKAPMTAGI